MARVLRVSGWSEPSTPSVSASSAADSPRARPGSSSPVQPATPARAFSVSGWSRPSIRSTWGSSAANSSQAPAGSPACPVQWAWMARAFSVSGWSEPSTPSTSGSSAETGRGPRPARPSSVQRALVAGPEGVGWSGPSTRVTSGSSAANSSRAPAGSPAFPVQWARSARSVSVPGGRSRVPRRRRAAAPRTGRGPGPPRPPPRSSGRGWRGP